MVLCPSEVGRCGEDAHCLSQLRRCLLSMLRLYRCPSALTIAPQDNKLFKCNIDYQSQLEGGRKWENSMILIFQHQEGKVRLGWILFQNNYIPSIYYCLSWDMVMDIWVVVKLISKSKLPSAYTGNWQYLKRFYFCWPLHVTVHVSRRKGPFILTIPSSLDKYSITSEKK